MISGLVGVQVGRIGPLGASGKVDMKQTDAWISPHWQAAW